MDNRQLSPITNYGLVASKLDRFIQHNGHVFMANFNNVSRNLPQQSINTVRLKGLETPKNGIGVTFSPQFGIQAGGSLKLTLKLAQCYQHGVRNCKSYRGTRRTKRNHVRGSQRTRLTVLPPVSETWCGKMSCETWTATSNCWSSGET